MSKANIIFVCHGSICRSPAAKFIMDSMSDSFNTIARAVSYEEIGNDIYPPMKKALKANKIPFEKHSATRISERDYLWADYIFYMDNSNLHYLRNMFPSLDKIHPIFEYSKNIFEIEDPWYTGNYQRVIEQIKKCCSDIIGNLAY